MLNLGDLSDKDVFQQGSAPSQQEIAEALSIVVDEASAALNSMTEDGLSNRIESALRCASTVLDELSSSLPKTQEECDEALRAIGASASSVRRLALDAGELSEQRRRLESEDSMMLTRKEAVDFVQVASLVLTDIRTALDEVSREEIEEISEVCLAIARMAVSSTRVAVRRMQGQAEEHPEEEGPVIEDISEDGTERPSQRSFISHSPRCRRYIWQPLLPQLRSCCVLPRLPRMESHKSYPLLAALLLGWPLLLLAAGAALLLALLVLPWLVLVDEALQRLYGWRQRQFEDFVESVLHFFRLGYLSVRLVLRRCVRVGRMQIKRFLRGRTVCEAAWDCASKPVSTGKAAAQMASQGVQAAWASLR